MKRRTTLYPLILFYCFIANASQANWETVLKQMNDAIASGDYLEAQDIAFSYLPQAKKEQNDTTRAQLYFGIAIGYFRPNTEAGLPYLDSAILYSSKNLSHKIRAYNAKSSFLNKLGALEKAKETSLLAYRLASEEPSRLFLGARNVSISYRMLERYDSALYYMLLADSLARLNGDERQQYLALQGAANIHLRMENFQQAVSLYRKIKSQIGSDEMMNKMNLGSAYFGLNDLDSALIFLNGSYEIAEKLKDSLNMANIYGTMGQVFLKKGLVDSAIYCLIKSKKLMNSNNPADLVSANSILLARAYFKKKDYINATNAAKKSYDMATISGQKKSQMKALELLATISKSQNDLASALNYNERTLELYKEINDEDRIDKIEELKTRYESERKDQELATLRQQNQINELGNSQQRILFISSISLLVLLLLLGVLFYQHDKSKTERKQLFLERNLLRAQMNPHFIFNALASIQGFITRNDRKEAASYLAKFGELTRDILEASRMEFIPLSKELGMIRNYVVLEQARFSKSLDLNIELDGFSDSEELLVPPMMIQPFLENAIKHGFKGRDSGKLDVLISKQKDSLHLSVKDNGIGMDEILVETKSSLAIGITKERLNHLRKYAKNLSLHIDNVKDESGAILGVEVKFDLPVVYGY